MDLFRRIFGKTSEESPAVQKEVTVDKPPPASDSVKEEVTPEDNDIDPATRPVESTAPLPSIEGVTQPLNPENLVSHKNGHIAFGQSTDVGLVRNNNQDAALSFFFTNSSVEETPDFGLFVVADGMGGHYHGERASALVTRILASHITNSIYLPILAGDNEMERTTISEALISGVQKANTEVIQNVPEGGTTVTAAAVIGDLLHIVHVGDSRAYLITADGIEQITRDHSLVQRLIELGQLTTDEAADHPQKNVLYRALGQNETLEVDTLTRRLPHNSRLLICSDGLWGQVEERELYELSMNNNDPQQACDKLVALANTRGGVDNITAILLRIT
jgi:PPM family protein phosphatase